MKIAIVTNILTPYRKRFYEELSKQLQETKGELRVFVMTDQLPLRPWKYDELKEKYTELLPCKKVFIKGEDFLFNKDINSKINKFGPDIVIVAGSWTYPSLWKLMLFKCRKKMKFFFWTESHNVRATKVGSSNWIVRKLKQFFYRRFDGYCVPGTYANATVNELVGDYGIRIKLPNLVDDEFYKFANVLRENKVVLREKYGVVEDRKIFISPTRLIPIKGIDLLLRNLSQVQGIENVTFLIPGEGPLEQEIRDISKQFGLDVRLLGYCDQMSIRELYALADFFLMPSLQDANPLTVIEAAFSGLPLCVSKYLGNCPELVIDRENGVVFDTVDKESVKQCFEFILTSTGEWRKNAGYRSLQIAENDFECENETKKILLKLNDVWN